MCVTTERLIEWVDEKVNEGYEIHIAKNIVSSVSVTITNLRTLQPTKVFVQPTVTLAIKQAYEAEGHRCSTRRLSVVLA